MITAGMAMFAALVIAMRFAPAPSRVESTLPPPRHAPTDWAAVADSIGGGVRAGDSLRHALDVALRHHDPHGAVLHAGTTLDDLAVGSAQHPLPAQSDEAVVVRALQTAVKVGGPAAAGLHAAAALLRERAAMRADAVAHSAQARLSARVLTMVPLAFCVLSAATSSSFRSVILTPAGATAAVAGLVVNLVGWVWMRYLVRRAWT